MIATLPLTDLESFLKNFIIKIFELFNELLDYMNNYKLKGKTMTDELATLTQDGDVSIITLDDGKANVFSANMSKTINSLLDQVPEDKGSLLITGRPGLFRRL